MILITINDVRKYRQLGKQLNDENFSGRVLEIQENELTELLGKPLSYDLFNYLETGWNAQAGTFTRISDTQFRAESIDLTAWLDYAIRINEDTFVVVKDAVLDTTDTILTIEGYVLPTLLTTIEFKVVNNYVKLLNGTDYILDSKTIRFNGLRGFIIWKFLAVFLADGNVKQSDVGNFSIASPNFREPQGGSITAAKSIYLQNSIREENNICEFLNDNNTLYPLWEQKIDNQNIMNYDFIVI